MSDIKISPVCTFVSGKEKSVQRVLDYLHALGWTCYTEVVDGKITLMTPSDPQKLLRIVDSLLGPKVN